MLERMQIIICGGTGCISSGGIKVKEEFDKQLKDNHLHKEISTVLTGCFGLCEKGPVVIIYPDQTFYSHVGQKDTVKDVTDIINEHVIKGRIVERLEVTDPITKKKIESFNELNFYAKQKRISLRNCGLINPMDINEYIAQDGYLALGTILSEMTPEQVIEKVKASGLRGRGGGGFPTGLKWQFARASAGDEKYVICNADEGDPGAFMDRAILEGDPHSILEAMAINGYAIGASKGFIYVRAEYPIAIDRLNIAINQAREYGLLGNNIFGSDFSFDVELRLGAGAFVCGEETALIASIEGGRGMPRLKPPFPAAKGLWGKPTNVNNVETFALIPVIFLKGPEWFKSIGTEKSSGTKVFALGGKIVNTGLIEVPMGTTLREAIFVVGGGVPNKRQFKAVQTGGPSGGCITEKDLDTPIDFDNLLSLDSMMGSGGMIVMDEDNCMVDVSRFYLDFTVDESCGKCTPCREGTKKMLDILHKIVAGEGTLADIDHLEELGAMIKETSLCGLGQTAPNPVISTIKQFRKEYEAHVVEKYCPAGVCRDLVKYYIKEKGVDEGKVCIGCGKCIPQCPTNAITGEPRKHHKINEELCISCGACKPVCPVRAIITLPKKVIK